jgi:type IX secretion system PorP/SprF family membrane protein
MKNFIYTLLLLFPLLSFGQDAHFSMYQHLAVYLNPALTGMQQQSQAAIQYRSQWSSVAPAYETYAVQFQTRKSSWGWGGVLHNNSAGEASLASSGGWLSSAFHKALSSGNNSLSAGLGVGFIQKRFNPKNLLFESQYQDGVLIDDNGEYFERASSQSIDFAVGANWNFEIPGTQHFGLQLGVNLAHLHQPKVNFFQALSALPAKRSVHLKANIGSASDIAFVPHLLWQQQGVHEALLIGSQVSFPFANNQFFVGASTRLKDAFILSTGLSTPNLDVHLSYDVNISNLKRATGGNGALELAVAYKFGEASRKPSFKKPKPKTPPLYQPPSPSIEQDCHECPSDLKDSDGDGVVDAKDKCPYDPGYVYLEGCMDADKDGINDREDACPYLPGPQSNHGCPTALKDSDGDGIPDAEDHCVYLKGERMFGGCPDTDKDGISDVYDHCPYLSGAPDNNGCPRPQARVQKKQWALIVEFDTDQSLIKPFYFMPLNELAMQAVALSDFDIIISGHTDAEGNQAYNYSLGQRRSQAIKNYLIRQGVPFNHIRTMSYGEDIPVRENYTPDGKSKNRRAEITLLAR